MKKEYLIYAGISLTVSLAVGYYFYNKYKPLVNTVNNVNSTLGFLGSVEFSVEDFFSNLFKGNPNGNNYTGTYGQMLD